jgi:dephospho-CoA kinase
VTRPPNARPPSHVRPTGPLRIGLTGPIGCGKSTVAGFLADRGAIVIDADQLARDVTEPGEPALAAIAERFGGGVIDDGRLDRAALGRIVFSDPASLADLEAIVHPAVRTRILAALAAAEVTSAPAVVLEAIRLVDGGYADLVDEVWLVDCAAQAQRERLASRGLDPDDAERRIAAQANLLVRARAAVTRRILTDGPLASTAQRVEEAFDTALERRRDV